MKHCFGILSLLLALVFSCSKPEPEPVVVGPEPLPFEFDGNLLAIDSLLQHDADSALMILLSLDKACLVPTGCDDLVSRTANACVGALLLSEALYKTYNPQDGLVETHGCASLQTAMRYFDSLAIHYPNNDDIAMFSARAHYMNGVGFYENDSVIEACEEYLKVLEIMENHFDVEKLTGHKAKFMGLTYTRLGALFSDLFIIKPAIYLGQQALFYCKIAPTSKYSISKNLYKLGQLYDILNVTDTAYYYYNEALKSLPDSNSLIYRDIISSIVIYNYGKDKNSKKAIDNLNSIINLTDDYDEKTTRYLTLGYIYYEKEAYDTALIYLKQVFDSKTDIVMKFQSAYYMHNIYQKFGDSLNTHKFERYLVDNTEDKYDNMMGVSILDKMFYDYLEQHKIKQLNPDSKTPIVWGIVVLILSGLIIYTISRIINRKKVRDANMKYHREKEKINKLKQRLIDNRSESERRFESFLNEPVCRKIIGMFDGISVSARSNYSNYTYLKLDDTTIDSFSEVVTKHFPNLKTRLVSISVDITQDDLLICYLYMLGLKTSQIAMLRQRHFTTISRQEIKLKSLIKRCKNLPDYIRKIAVS